MSHNGPAHKYLHTANKREQIERKKNCPQEGTENAERKHIDVGVSILTIRFDYLWALCRKNNEKRRKKVKHRKKGRRRDFFSFFFFSFIAREEKSERVSGVIGQCTPGNRLDCVWGSAYGVCLLWSMEEIKFVCRIRLTEANFALD